MGVSESVSTYHSEPEWYVAGLNPFAGGIAEVETLNDRANARWIAALSPAVAGPLVAWLRSSALKAKTGLVRPDANALAFSRAVLGESSGAPDEESP